jgi:hypothetical protein
MTRRSSRTGACLVGVLGLASVALSQIAQAAAKPAWDQVANIKSAATQIADIQKRDGAQGAMRFISACYKTHGLATAYSKFFESCIAQDYMQSRALALVYARVPSETLKKSGAPSPADVAKFLDGRLSAAFSQYDIKPSEGQDLIRLIETHGMPVFLSTVFPDSDRSSQPPSQTNRPR